MGLFFHPLNTKKSGFPAMAMRFNCIKLWGKEFSKLHLRESAQPPWEWWKMKGCGWVNSLGMLFQAFTFPKSQIHPFPKWVAPQIRIWLPYPSHPHALISQPLPKWLGTKDKNGSWKLYGFSPWHLDFLHWPKGLNGSPPLSLWDHAPSFQRSH